MEAIVIGIQIVTMIFDCLKQSSKAESGENHRVDAMAAEKSS